MIKVIILHILENVNILRARKEIIKRYINMVTNWFSVETERRLILKVIFYVVHRESYDFLQISVCI